MLQQPDWLGRVLEWYSKETGESVGCCALKGLPLEDLQRHWGMASGDPMVECFEISEDQAEFLRAHVNMAFDLERFDCFLSAVTLDLEAARREGGFLGKIPPPVDLPAFPDAKSTRPKTKD